MKKIIVLLFMLANCSVFAHGPNAHRHIVYQAWKLLIHEKPELSNTIIASWIGGPTNTDYLTSVIAGAHNEDNQDIIWMNCGINIFDWEKVSCPKRTLNHFWIADNGDYDPVTILGSEPNALQKAKHMWYGTHSFLVGKYTFYRSSFIDKLDHNGLADLHNTGNVKLYGYWNLRGEYYNSYNSKQYNTTFRRRVSYSILGRIAHLLADMSVPAHAHNDAHSWISEDGVDDYERWVNDNYYPYTWEDALEQGGTLFDVTEKEFPVRYLMYAVNQYADFFPSDGEWDGNYPGNRDYNDTYYKDGITDDYPILDKIFDQLGSPPTNVNLTYQAEHLMPFIIRATAALLYLFAIETGQYVPPPPPLLARMSGPESLSRFELGTWTVTAEGGTPPYSYKWSYFKSCDENVIPCDTWVDLSQQTSSLSKKDDSSFKIKCVVTDKIGWVKEVSKSVTVGGNIVITPSAPRNLSISESSNEHPLLMWDVNTDSDEPEIDGYNIYRKGGYPFVDWKVIATTTPEYGRIAKKSYEDTELTVSGRRGEDYHYKVTAFNIHESEYSNVVGIEAQLGKQIVKENLDLNIKEYALDSNYPNPFNPTTQISYQIPKNDFVNLVVYNSLGQLVATLVDRHQASGKYSVQFDANNLPSGIYYYKLQTREFSSVNKMILTK